MQSLERHTLQFMDIFLNVCAKLLCNTLLLCSEDLRMPVYDLDSGLDISSGYVRQSYLIYREILVVFRNIFGFEADFTDICSIYLRKH